MPRFFGIIPAAGRSARMGQPKLLLPWRGSTVLAHVLDAWRTSCVDRTVLVVHPDDEQVAAIGTQAGVNVVIASAPPPDMKASVRIALDHLKQTVSPTAEDHWLVAPADLPTLSSDVIDAVIQAVPPAQEPIVVPVDERGERGHPVRFAWPLTLELTTLGDHEGINQLLQRYPVWKLSCPGSFDSDLDTPADYESLRNRYDRPDRAL